MSDSGPLALLEDVASLLDGLKVRWCLGGSLAAAFHGAARMTRDLDIVIEMDAARSEELARALEPRYYVSRSAMEEAVRERRSFNAVDVESGYKVDFFVAGTSSFDRRELDGLQWLPLPGSADRRVPVKSVEDTILRKLLWFRDGGAVSDLQWRDVVELLRINAPRLDRAHLRAWSATLGLAELLERAAREAET